MPKVPFVIGVDLGGTNVRAAVVEEETGKIVARSANVPSQAIYGADVTAQQTAIAVKGALDAAKIDMGRIRGIGMAVPGHIDPKKGEVLWAPNFKDQWRGVLLAKIVSDLLGGVRVFLGNDANLAALGEYKYGAGRGSKHLVMFTLGTGVGGGIIIDGKLLTGSDGGAGELGHIFVAGGCDGARGGLAMFGTLEGMAQRDAITERAARKIASGRRTTLSQGSFDKSKLTPKLISDAAEHGDAVALEVFDETGYYIGLGVASCINIFNPEVFVIGGGIAQAGDVLLDPIIRTAAANAINTMFEKCRIVSAELGDNAGIMGGAALIDHELKA